MTSRKGLAALGALVLALGGCQTGAGAGSGATSSSAVTPSAAITEHESGPETPLDHGLLVPRGATQLGPLARYRSPRTIEAYQPDLAAAVSRRGVADALSAAGDNPDGVAAPEPPEGVVSSRPGRDSFELLEEPPEPDVTAAFMRIDGDPTVAVTSMVAQIADLLPEAGLDPADLTTYCSVVSERVQDCSLDVSGVTAGGEELRVQMAVDPGDVSTRISPPSSLTRPVMQVRIEETGDPRLDREGGDDDVDLSDEVVDPTSRVVWPAMDLDAPQATPLMNGWTRPPEATLLLSGFRPGFATLFLERGREAQQIARDFAGSLGPDVPVTRDVVEELNEVDTTFTAVAPSGERAVATHVLTARGHYVLLSYTPAPPPEG
ncbi:hypothetical protein HMPREF0063_13060 [Aeromicrobium marinum DSM 15272]|uniref:Tat pathway signal sequence domain protein n=1 Tax=Aeromicrobium marinum DSM 15272 TaxID=585531 RepID=E2SGA1_9ACTN|nr:hypothetical protein [Aeromicrobium marinum]EFQ81858.1 hypothetical protein HMPREF0063_13060 [Aeromicrobium marinum DSM 15272]